VDLDGRERNWRENSTIGEDRTKGSKRACCQGHRKVAPAYSSYSIHANTAVAAQSRTGLERLCRYGMRPAFSQERLSLTEFAELLRRVFAIDILVCARCGGKMKLLACISDEKIAARILSHLGLPASSPPLAPARLPAQLELQLEDGQLDDPGDDGAHHQDHPGPAPPARRSGADSCRAPPHAPDDCAVDLDQTEPGGDWDWVA